MKVLRLVDKELFCIMISAIKESAEAGKDYLKSSRMTNSIFMRGIEDESLLSILENAQIAEEQKTDNLNYKEENLAKNQIKVFLEKNEDYREYMETTIKAAKENITRLIELKKQMEDLAVE